MLIQMDLAVCEYLMQALLHFLKLHSLQLGIPEGLVVSHKHIMAQKKRRVNLAREPFQMYGIATIPLPTITEGAKLPRNVRGRIAEPMPQVTDSTLRDVPIALFALFCVYIQIRDTVGRSYRVMVMDMQIGSVLPNMTKSIN